MTDLTDRMRTCAAAMLYEAGPDETKKQWQDDAAIYRDAADLLIEASNALESAAETLERGAYDLRDGGYLRSATILEEEAGKMKGEPMEIIPPGPIGHEADATQHFSPLGTWIAPGGPLPGLTRSGTISPRACPKCDSRAAKRVRREGNRLMLVCPVCATEWEYKP